MTSQLGAGPAVAKYHPDPEIDRVFDIISSAFQPEEIQMLLRGDDRRSVLLQKLRDEGYELLGVSPVQNGKVVLSLQLPSGCTLSLPLELT